MDLLDRLHQRLIEALGRSDPRPALPTIAEIYQQLIPYRALRDHLDVSELAEYEHALLRLLAGERGLASVDDDAARGDLQRELASINPILGVYRDHPDARVRILPAGAASTESDPSSAPGEVTPATSAMATPPAAAADEPRVITTTAIVEPNACEQCARTLPALPEIGFCPFCGTAIGAPPCRHCGTPVEPDWSFCARCGAQAR